MKKGMTYLLIGILGIHLLLLVYLKFTAWPETLLWPFLMIKGWLPYSNIAIAHTPLLLVKLAIFFKLFGVGIIQLKAFTWLIILLLDALIFLVAKKLWKIRIAVFVTAAFVLWQLFVEGNGLWFDLFMAVSAFVSFYFVQKKKWLLAGVFFAAAAISKQTAVWFLLPIVWQMVGDKKLVIKSITRFAAGSLAVFVPSLLLLWFSGILPSFYNWAVNFGIFILPKAQGQVHLPGIKNLAVAAFPFLVFLPLLFNNKNLKGTPLSLKTSLAIWAFAGSLGAYPRFEYFHFQPAVPFLAIASGLVLSEFKKIKGSWKVFLSLYLAGSLILFAGFFMRNWREGTRFFEADVSEVASYVRNNTKPNDKIFVLNWWDNIYALADREPSVNPWVPQLSWYMEIPGIQERIVADLMTSPPKFIIYYPYTKSGLSSYIPPKVFEYITSHYSLKEKVDGVEILVSNAAK